MAWTLRGMRTPSSAWSESWVSEEGVAETPKDEELREGASSSDSFAPGASSSRKLVLGRLSAVSMAMCCSKLTTVVSRVQLQEDAWVEWA